MTVYFRTEADEHDPFTPLGVAKALIDTQNFSNDDLLELSEYLQTYARYRKIVESNVYSKGGII